MKNFEFYYKKANVILLICFLLAFSSFLLLYFSPIQNLLILVGEKLISRPLNHEVWLSRFDCWAKLFTPIFLSLLFFKFFSLFFAKKCSNSFLNLIRCIAMMMVYVLHTSIFTNSRGIFIFDKLYMKIFYTPAWGGVWIFFILGGFLAGKSFADKRYNFEMKNICHYYSNKFLKVIVPTFSFIFLCCVLVHPSYIKNNPIALLKFLTFSYNGNPGANGIGATWYVFTLVPLYLLTPIFSYIAEILSKTKLNLILLFGALFALGFLYRFFAVKNNIDWYNMVYTPFFANIDLFFCGIIFSQIVKVFNFEKVHSKIFKDISLFILLSFILINSIFYESFFFYRVFCPSIYLILVGVCLFVFSDEKWVKSYERPVEKLISFFSSISFEFYLFHSLVFHTILPVFGEQKIMYLHFKLLFTGFILSTICAVGFKRIFRGKNERI